MKKEIVFSEKATVPRGPYAQAIKVSEFKSVIYTGTIASLDENWNIVGANDLEAQVRKTIENLGHILEAAGATFENVVQTTWYLTNIKDMPAVAKIRDEMFGGCVPASGTIPIKSLYFDELMLEMDAVIVL